MISIAHRIELKPNNKQKTYFRKAFGCARLAYNWGLAEWERMYKAGEKPKGTVIRKRFNAIKKEQFPFVYEVTKCAVDQLRCGGFAIRHLLLSGFVIRFDFIFNILFNNGNVQQTILPSIVYR